MEKCCENCKFWCKKDRIPDAIEDTHRECQKAVFGDGYNPVEIKSSPMVTCDGSGYFGILYTAKSHCCNSWAKQE